MVLNTCYIEGSGWLVIFMSPRDKEPDSQRALKD